MLPRASSGYRFFAVFFVDVFAGLARPPVIPTGFISVVLRETPV
jgi:hypothetical protein